MKDDINSRAVRGFKRGEKILSLPAGKEMRVPLESRTEKRREKKENN